MRCSGSPTTCIAADPRAAEADVARELATAMLFREILKPLAAGLGPVGEMALSAAGDALLIRRPPR